MGYLDLYDSATDDQVRVGLVQKWIRTSDWRPFFAELREKRPVLVTPAFTLFARYADVVEVLSRETVFTVRLYARSMDPTIDGPFMLSRDGTAVNWREKSIMRAVLRPEDLPAVRDVAGRLADEALNRTAEDGRIEAVNELGRYVPLRLCGEYFGFHGPDLESMYRWSKATQTDMFKNLKQDPVLHEASVRAGIELLCYLHELLQQKRAELRDKPDDPPQDTFARLVRTHLPPELGFDDHRLVANVAGLLIGAGETTAQAIVQALEQILARPEVRARAIEAAHGDRAAFDAYVWEALRFNPINPLIFRLCERPYTVAAGTPRATQIKPGTLVFALTASAMCDADAFPEPEAFRTDRPDPTMLHFGYGHHACLGEHVASVMIPEVVRRFLLRPDPRLLPGPEGAVDFKGGPFPESFVVGFGEPRQPHDSDDDPTRSCP